MKKRAGKALAIVVLGATLLAGLLATGCAHRAAAPAAVEQQSASPASASPAASSTAASGTTAPSPTVDAAGAAIGTSLTVGSASSSSKGGIPRPADKTATDEAVRLLHQSQDIGKVQKVAVRSMTQDKKGRWWVLVAIDDDQAGSDQAVLTYNGKSWDVMVFGEGVSDDDLPPDVRF